MTFTAIDNFLSSGHHFSEDENLEKFRFSLLNTNLAVAAFFSGLSYFFSVSNFTKFDPIYEIMLLIATIVYGLCVFPLRANKLVYLRVANITLINSLILFYGALVTTFVEDEFRLIWFFLVVFASFILMGKRYGITLMLFVLISIGVTNQFHDLGFSRPAQVTFVISFIIFAAFAYNFLNKIENDALEFRQLNLKLAGKVDKEVNRREQQEQMLLQQYRMANMGSMLDAIAHQWRQPLMNINAILMNMDHSLGAKVVNTNYLGEKVDEVALLTEHMSQTIEDFRDLLKEEKLQTLVKIESAVEEVLGLMKNSLNDIIVECRFENGSDVIGHKSELMQVIIILLSNAIEVFDKRLIEDKKINVTVSTFQEKATIIIEDNAGGIANDKIAHIFDPYFTTKEQSGGTGLGLYIAKIIIEQRMEGAITASNTNHGAKFTLLFPGK